MAITAQCADCTEGLVNFDWSPRATAMDWGEDWCLGVWILELDKLE